MAAAGPLQEPIHPTIARALRGLGRRVRTRRALVGAALALSVSLVAFIAAILADRFLFLSVETRRLIAGGAVTMSGLCALAACARSLVPIAPIRVAWRAERGDRRLGEGLVTAVEIEGLRADQRGRFSKDLVEALFIQTEERLRDLDARSLVPLRGAAGALAVAVGLWAALAVCILADAFSLRLLTLRFLYPSADLARPSSVLVEVSPGDSILGIGEDAVIGANIRRGRPSSVLLRWRRPEEAQWRESPMDRVPATKGPEAREGELPSAFEKRLRSLQSSIEYRVRSGDFESRGYRILVRKPPRPVSFRILVTYPDYSGRAAETLKQSGGDLVAVRGARAAIEVVASQPLERARVEGFPALSGERDSGRRPGVDVELTTSGASACSPPLALEVSGTYRLYLESADGVSNRSRDEYGVRVLADRHPDAEILEPAASELTLDRASFVEVRYEARDDLGVRSVDAVLDVGGSELAIPVWSPATEDTADRPRATRTRLAGTWLLDLRGIDPAPGKPVALRIRARDGLGQEGVSSPRTLRLAELPPPPEGPTWPASLRAIDAGLAAVLRDLTDGGIDPGETATGVALAEEAGEGSRRWAARALSIRERLSALGDAATDAGRSVAVPSVLLGFLEDLGTHLRETAELDSLDVFAEASGDGAGLPAALARTEDRVVSAAEACGALLEAEDLEEILEASLALCWDATRCLEALHKTEGGGVRGGVSPGTLRTRLQDILTGCTVLAARLSARRGPQALGQVRGANWEPLAVGILEAAIGEFDAARKAADSGEETTPELERAVASLGLLSSRLFDRWRLRAEEARKAAIRITARGRLAALLENLAQEVRARADAGSEAPADSMSSGSEARSWRAALHAASEALARVEEAREVDPVTRATLSSLLRLLEALARDALEDGSAEACQVRLGRVEAILAAWRATAPARAIGEAVSCLRLAASGEEEIAWRLRPLGTEAFRAVRQGLRAHREIDGLVADAFDLLAGLGAPGSATSGRDASADLDRAVRGVRDRMLVARRSAQAALEPIAAPSEAILRGEPRPAGGLERGLLGADPAKASDALAALAREIRAVAEGLVAIRDELLPEAFAAALWLESEAGPASSRVLAIAARVQRVADETRTLSSSAWTKEAPLCVDELIVEAEDAREDVRRAARELGGGRGIVAERGGRPAAEEIAARDRVASEMEAAARGPMLEASRGLMGARGAGPDLRPGMLLEASLAAAGAADSLRSLAALLRELETAEAAGIAAAEVEGLLRGAAETDPDLEELDPKRLAEISRRLHAGTLRAAKILAARTGMGLLRDAILDLMAEAAALFAEAAAAGDAGDAGKAVSFLAEGKERLAEAAATARSTRAQSAEQIAKRLPSTDPKDGVSPASADGEGDPRETERAAEDVRALLDLERMEDEIARLFDRILRDSTPDVSAIAEIRELTEAVDEELERNFVSTAELVELVATLVRIDREGSDLAGRERTLAARTIPSSRGENRVEGSEQEAALARARDLVEEFHRAGLELSAALPLVFRAYWKGQDRAALMVAAMEHASKLLEMRGDSAARSEASDALLAAAARIDGFLAAVGEMRREALEAIADEERGFGELNSAHRAIERARREIADAIRLLDAGNLGDASLAQAASRRSVADARAAVLDRRRRSSGRTEAGISLGDRLLLETALEEGAEWRVLARGEEPRRAVREALDAPDSMPFPARFRDLVRLYLRALSVSR